MAEGEKKSTPAVPEQQALEVDFGTALQVVDDIVLKNYIARLKMLEILPLDPEIQDENLSENVRFFKINQMVYEKDEFATYKFASVFNALSTLNCAVFIILDSDGRKTDFYMGIRSLNSNRTTDSLKETLEKSMQGQFPGIQTTSLMDDEMQAMLERIKPHSISSVSCIANAKDANIHDNQAFIQGLEKLAFSMQGSRYTAIILANSATQAQFTEIRQNYESIYTKLVPFAKAQINYSTNSSVNHSQSSTAGHSVSDGVSHNYSKSSATSHSTTAGTSHSTSSANMASKALSGLSAATSILGAALAPVTGGLMSLAIGSVIAGGLSAAGSAVQKTESDTCSESKTYTESETSALGGGDSHTETDSQSQTDTKGISSGSGESLTLNRENKTISGILERLNTQLKRLQEFESLGMWECAAYFISDADNPFAAEIAASTYKAIMRGENSGVEMSAINSWALYDGDEKVRLLSDYLKHFVHPVFAYEGATQTIEVTPCCLVSGNELALHMGLPRKSVCGLPVVEHAGFGQEVNYAKGHQSATSIKLGNIFHMGSASPNVVHLDLKSLSMHTFITGSTGSGKSNTVYELLRQLELNGVSYMVVEPAKGEYKNVFGAKRNVTVLGTNPAYTRLLQINPFKFPQQIHVLEHIDRLVEIFNVCWPMYAAMPAVLKDALLQAYQVCGWDLVESRNTVAPDLFPTFQDLQAELVDVIESSAYSQEVKGNYMGSLTTRVKSLTNGLNGQIFSANEIDNTVLFDSNVIVDLSRVGSLETKSLIMGVLVMRLNEHRMANSTGMNMPLKHITVLEEAHNILKRTASEQNPENPSVTGKSVEMLSNAIAEMRTYGEGFIIADQSPSAVDISAIRNTNTKIIMRLPDETDRRLAGKAAALKDEQLDEIAKLPKGVAVVYQNDWLEPVLCKVKKFSGDEIPYKVNIEQTGGSDIDAWFTKELLKLLMKGRVNEQIDIDIDRMENILPLATISTKNKIGIHRILDEYKKTGELRIWHDTEFAKLSELTTELLDVKNQVDRYVAEAMDFDELSCLLHTLIHDEVEGVSDEVCLSISQCLMKEFSSEAEGNEKIYAAWRASVMKRGGLL